MKTRFSFGLIVLAGLLAVAGCSSPASVASLEGKGVRRTYDMGYEPVWEAVASATTMDDLCILNEDKTHGFISARRGMAQVTFGDCVAIWVRRISPDRTEVEVVSRRTGAPVPFAPDHQQALLGKVTEILTF